MPAKVIHGHSIEIELGPFMSKIQAFKDCFIPTTTYEKGPLQFEIDEQLNTTWYKK